MNAKIYSKFPKKWCETNLWKMAKCHHSNNIKISWTFTLRTVARKFYYELTLKPSFHGTMKFIFSGEFQNYGGLMFASTQPSGTPGKATGGGRDGSNIIRFALKPLPTSLPLSKCKKCPHHLYVWRKTGVIKKRMPRCALIWRSTYCPSSLLFFYYQWKNWCFQHHWKLTMPAAYLS